MGGLPDTDEQCVPVQKSVRVIGRRSRVHVASRLHRPHLLTFLSELLLTADEVVAILSNATSAAAVANDETAPRASEEESRREAEALCVLLSADGPLAAARPTSVTRNKGGEYKDDDGITAERSRGDEGDGTAAALPGVLKDKDQRGGGKQDAVVAASKAAMSALTRLAARYLVRETVRGKIPDPVGNFHVRIVSKGLLAECECDEMAITR